MRKTKQIENFRELKSRFDFLPGNIPIKYKLQQLFNYPSSLKRFLRSVKLGENFGNKF